LNTAQWPSGYVEKFHDKIGGTGGFGAVEKGLRNLEGRQVSIGKSAKSSIIRKKKKKAEIKGELHFISKKKTPHETVGLPERKRPNPLLKRGGEKGDAKGGIGIVWGWDSDKRREFSGENHKGNCERRYSYLRLSGGFQAVVNGRGEEAAGREEMSSR